MEPPLKRTKPGRQRGLRAAARRGWEGAARPRSSGQACHLAQPASVRWLTVRPTEAMAGMARAAVFRYSCRIGTTRSTRMTMPYETAQPERSAIDALPGAVALDFGTNWCGYCRAAESPIESALAG